MTGPLFQYILMVSVVASRFIAKYQYLIANPPVSASAGSGGSVHGNLPIPNINRNVPVLASEQSAQSSTGSVHSTGGSGVPITREQFEDVENYPYAISIENPADNTFRYLDLATVRAYRYNNQMIHRSDEERLGPELFAAQSREAAQARIISQNNEIFARREEHATAWLNYWEQNERVTPGWTARSLTKEQSDFVLKVMQEKEVAIKKVLEDNLRHQEAMSEHFNSVANRARENYLEYEELLIRTRNNLNIHNREMLNRVEMYAQLQRGNPELELRLVPMNNGSPVTIRQTEILVDAQLNSRAVRTFTESFSPTDVNSLPSFMDLLHETTLVVSELA